MERGTASTNGVETYYERRGSGPPIVFVHAAVLDHGQWDRQVAALADEYTTVAYDVRGHGRTGGSELEPYSIELFVEDLDALVGALGLDRPVLVGLSMGGCIAQAYAATYPDRIAGLVLGDTFTPNMSTLRERLLLAGLRAAVLPARLVGYERIQRLLTGIHELFNRGARGDYETVVELQAAMPPMETDEFAKVIRAVAAFPGVELDLSRISVPTLVLYGEHVPATLVRQAGMLAAGIPNASIREVPGGGHASNLDDPAFFTAAVRELCARATAGDDG